MMNSIYRIAGFSGIGLFCFAFLFLSSCRRSTEPEVGIVAKVPISIDWSESELDLANMDRASIWIFPHDGSAPYDVVFEKDLTKGVLSLPLGRYSFVVINETTDPAARPRLTFVGQDRYDTFSVLTTDDEFRGVYPSSAADGSSILYRRSPNRVASWSLDEFDVTPSMVVYTQDRTRVDTLASMSYDASVVEAVNKELDKLLHIKPKPRVKVVTVTARVQNLVSARKVSGTINGVVAGVNLATGKAILDPVTHVFALGNRTYDDLTTRGYGTMSAVVHMFDMQGADAFKFSLHLDFLKHNDKISNEIIDITEDLRTDQTSASIYVGFMTGDRPDDRVIQLPIIPESEGAVDVDQWQDVLIPLD